jgi:hypothetical protein
MSNSPRNDFSTDDCVVTFLIELRSRLPVIANYLKIGRKNFINMDEIEDKIYASYCGPDNQFEIMYELDYRGEMCTLSLEASPHFILRVTRGNYLNVMDNMVEVGSTREIQEIEAEITTGSDISGILEL